MALSQNARKALEQAMPQDRNGQADGKEVADAIEPAAAVADIADPSTATAEDVANKVNELLASLRAGKKLA